LKELTIDSSGYLNFKNSTIEGKIKVLVWLSNFHGDKSLKDMSRLDILEYLNKLRKSYSEVPTNKWIGTYNWRQSIMQKFFRWQYFPDEDHRKRANPV